MEGLEGLATAVRSAVLRLLAIGGRHPIFVVRQGQQKPKSIFYNYLKYEVGPRLVAPQAHGRFAADGTV
jgi:hypothetical protein